MNVQRHQARKSLQWTLLTACASAAIHNAAGRKLLEACKALPIVQKPSVRCPTGDAKITEYDSRGLTPPSMRDFGMEASALG